MSVNFKKVKPSNLVSLKTLMSDKAITNVVCYLFLFPRDNLHHTSCDKILEEELSKRKLSFLVPSLSNKREHAKEVLISAILFLKGKV